MLEEKLWGSSILGNLMSIKMQNDWGRHIWNS